MTATTYHSEAEMTGGCPVPHNDRKTSQVVDPVMTPIERDAHGVWQVRGFDEARAILRSNGTKQAGFNAEMIERFSSGGRQPILYQEGKAHQAQRKQTARFFTPKAVSENYREIMDSIADELIAALRQEKHADLSQLTLNLAVRVAAQVIGLTNSSPVAMSRRLASFFDDVGHPSKNQLVNGLRGLLGQIRSAIFFFRDVRPAIEARRKEPKDDLISHLIKQGYSDAEILTECVTYGAAGMVTTREFISVATWHLLDRPALHARYLVAGEEERYAMLEEILRIEPVAEDLFRRTTEDLHIESQGREVVIPAGELITLHVTKVNTDPAVVGEDPLLLCPGRELLVDRVAPSVMGFGDGHHRCPGSYVAIQETDTFLCKLMALDGLRIVRAPTITRNEVAKSYELRDFQIAVN